MNDRYGWNERDRFDRDRRASWRRHSDEGSYRSSDRDEERSYWRGEDDDWRSRGGFDREQRFGGTGAHGYDAGPGGRDQGARQSQAGPAAPPQPYYTGQQQGWEVPSSYGAPGAFGASYGGGTGTYGGGAGGSEGFGEDYREHGYAGRRHERGFLQRAGDEVASWFGDEDAARRREADHRGRGPADYTRSDERIREDANDRLTDDWRVDASKVTVAVQKGEVTLNGTVTSRDAKRRAEDIVDDISGVNHVRNNLRIDPWTAAGASGGATKANTSPT